MDNTWTPATPDPLEADHLVSAWTPKALLSLDAGSIDGTTRPGDATAYDPATNRWTRLAAAPTGCEASPAPPMWTGRRVLYYCAETGTPSAGLVFTPGAPR